jgi:phage shock protein PspC (stress-responsive transcriptional regulator)
MTSPDAPPPYRPLLRTRDDRVVAGVAGGLGRWLDIDPVIFRVTFAVLTFFGGLGLVGYLIGYLLIPDEATGTPLVPTRRLPDPRRLTAQQRALAAWTLAGVAVLIAIVGHRSTTVAVLLIIAAVTVLAAREGHRPVGATGFTPAPSQQPSYAFSTPQSTVTPPTTPYTWTPPPAPHYATVERGPRLNRALISASLLAAGVYLTIGQAGAYKPLALQAIAVALTTLGVGLAITAWRARSRGALVLGVLLSLIVMVGSVVEGDYGSSVGRRVWRPADTAAIAGNYKLAVGNATLDLTELNAGQLAGRTVNVTMGIGKLTVLLPGNTPISAYGNVEVGDFEVFDDRWSGPEKQTVTTPGWTPSNGLRLQLHLRVGNVEVRNG